MDFDFNDEQFSFQESTRGFLDATFGQRRVGGAPVKGIDPASWRKLAETGTFSMLVPEAFGGMGLSFADLALVLEEHGRALVPVPVADMLAAIDAVARFATPDQKKRLLPALATAGLTVVPALSEADAAAGTLATIAKPAGSGWRITGRKVMVPGGAAIDHVLVSARFADAAVDGLVVIERGRAGTTWREQSTLDLTGRYDALELDDVVISEADVVGGKPSPAAVSRLQDAGSLVAALMMTGIAGKVLDETVKYVSQRVQFGKPVGSFQAIKHRCADMAVAIESARAAAYYAAWAMSEDSADRAKAVSMAKSMCGETARFVCNEGIQLHGGIGFTWELGLHNYLRRAKVLEHAYGDISYHRERVMAAILAELSSGDA